MKRPLRYRTMGAVREGRGNPSPYSMLGMSILYRVKVPSLPASGKD